MSTELQIAITALVFFALGFITGRHLAMQAVIRMINHFSPPEKQIKKLE